MDPVPAQIGSSTVLFEPLDIDVPASAVSTLDAYGTSETSGARSLKDAYTQLKDLLRDVSDDLGSALASGRARGLTSVEVEFALGFTAEANAWVFKASGEGSITARLSWDLSRSE